MEAIKPTSAEAWGCLGHSGSFWSVGTGNSFNSLYWISGFLLSKAIWGTAEAKSLQSCLTLCDPIDGSPPGSPVPGILQARTLEWAAISFSNAWKWKMKSESEVSRVRLLATPWPVAHQAPPSMGFSSKSTGVGCHCLLQYGVLVLIKNN